MKAALFPGQGSQFIGMGLALYNDKPQAKGIFEKANDIIGFDLTQIMHEGPEESLKQTNITQPAVFVHSLAALEANRDAISFDAVAGHSLGEISALVAAECISFEQGLLLVKERADSMQDACEKTEGTMAAILGLEDWVVEKVCEEISEVVVAANYNCPGQLVISGSISGVEQAVEQLKEKGARRALILNVRGAFHSELMKPAGDRLKAQIEKTQFSAPKVPIYQNVTATAHTDPEVIKENLLVQLTSPVKWTQSMQAMIDNGINSFTEFGGNGKTLTGFVRRISKEYETASFN